MPLEGQGVRGHILPLIVLAAMSIVWTWPLALHFHDHVPGPPGDNYSFLWNFWWMRKALSAPELDFFQSRFLFSPFGVDLINLPHTALPAYVSATALGALTFIEAENLYIFLSVFLNAVCAYALVFDITRDRLLGVLAGVAFGGSPFVAAHLMGRFDLLSAWVLPLFALFLRRSLQSGRVGAAIICGLCVAIAAYSAFPHVVSLAVFAVAYTFSRRNGAQVSRQQTFWRSTQALMIAAAVGAVLCLPLIAQEFKLVVSGRYAGHAGFWPSEPHGIVLMINPFHPLGGIGIVPLVVLFIGRGKWLDNEEARRWKIVLAVFAIWALAASALAPLPGGAMVGVYLALGVLMALRLAGLKTSAGLKDKTRPTSTMTTMTTVAVVILALDYLHAPIPLTSLDRPAVYEQLASIQDNAAMIEVPFGDRRLVYYATIHGHPVVGGFSGRMPPMLAQAYDAMPVVGNLLRLSNGEPAVVEERSPWALPFRYLVLNTETASPELVDYVRQTLDMDLIGSGGGRELYAVQGARPADVTARK